MKTIIVYFTWSNNTKHLVEDINKEFHFDLLRIERKEAYSSNYDVVAYKESKEEVIKKIHPDIKDINIDLSSYDRILLFFPIWWYTYPMVIGTFLDQLKEMKYTGEIVYFANSYTNDPQYMVNSFKDMKEIDTSFNIKEGLFNKSVNEHIQFIKSL